MDNDKLVFGEALTTDLFGDVIEVVKPTVKKDDKSDDKSKDDKSDDKKGDKLDADGNPIKDADDKSDALKEAVKDSDKTISVLFDEPAEGDKSDDKSDGKSEDKKDDKKDDKSDDALEDDIDYEGLAQVYVEMGDWAEFELEEGATLDKETFIEMQKTQNEMKAKALSDSVFSKLSDNEREYLEFVKNGGTFNDYIETHSIKQSVEDIDITSDAGQKAAVYSYYKNMVGWSDDMIQKHIGRLEADIELEEHAKLAKEKLGEVVNEQHAKRVAKQTRKAEERVKLEESYKSDIKASLKTAKVNTKRVNQIVKDFTDRDDKGFTEIDKKFLELRNNPEKIKFLHDVLMNTDTFLKNATQKEVNKEKLNTFKVLKFKKAKKSVDAPSGDSGFVDIGLR